MTQATADTLVPMADLASRWGVTPNTVSRRLSFLGIRPVRQGNYRFITTDELKLADDLHQHVLSGKPQEWFSRPEAEEGEGRVLRQVKRQAIELAQPDQSAALMLAAIQQLATPPADPLRRARGLAEASDHGLVLTTEELAALGVKGADGFGDGEQAYGFCFRKHKQRGRALWTVERDIALADSAPTRALPPATSRATHRDGIGFAAFLEVPAIRPELPRW